YKSCPLYDLTALKSTSSPIQETRSLSISIPVFSEGTIICNSFLSSHWGQEEKTDPSPLEANEPFQIEIYSDREHFQVFIDDSKIIQFRHRVKHFSGITKLQILNDINISSVEICRREMYE
ncbi:unnamed protein product, partial [Staurois parvus]